MSHTGRIGQGQRLLVISGYSSHYLYFSPPLLVEAEAEEPGAEAEENALRRRRLAFYRRGGFRDLGYTARIFGVPYAMLVSGQSDQAEAAEAHRRLYHYEFSPWLYRRFIHIPEED